MLGFTQPSALPTRPVRVNSTCPRRPPTFHATRVPNMVISDQETARKPVRITGNNITITESIRVYVEEKLGKVERRFNSLISKIHVHLTVEHNPSVPNRHKAEVVIFAGKTILRNEVRAYDMYAAIDEVEERIARNIRKFKERKEAKGVGKAKDVPLTDAGLPEDEEEEDGEDAFNDVYQDRSPGPGIPPVDAVVKRKVFPMPLQTVEEAVLCCEYVDHPWYLFRNATTKEISIVYRRNNGGYGLIEPSNPGVVDEEPV